MQTIDSSVPPLTNGEKELYDELEESWGSQKDELEKILNNDVPAFNKLLKEKGVQYIAPQKEKKDSDEENNTST